jgi:hypothetical protein
MMAATAVAWSSERILGDISTLSSKGVVLISPPDRRDARSYGPVFAAVSARGDFSITTA